MYLMNDDAIKNNLQWVSQLSIDVQPSSVRKTSIICTIGPATNSVETITALREAGMNIVRMNFSHGSYEYHQSVIDNTRQSYLERPGRPVAIALDTKGPEIRTGLMLNGEDVPFRAGHQMIFTTNEEYACKSTGEVLYIDYKNLTKVVEPGKIIFIDDGVMSFKVLEVDADMLKVEALNDGKLSSKKGVNLPKTDVDLPALSEKDIRDLQFGVEQNVDIVFASFIRRGEDVREIRQILGEKGKHIKIISKIENHQGVANFDQILAESDGIMVARGDLGIEIPCTSVFLAQKMMIAKCNLAGKPVICATQMLESMTYNPRPTRAEVSDVANAVLDGSDCTMLSSETAKGQYPLEAVKTMHETCLLAETAICYPPLFNDLRALTPRPTETTETVASSAVSAAHEQKAGAIIVLTTSGLTARMVSKYRPQCPIITITRNAATARQVHLYRGCYPFHYQEPKSSDWQQDVDARLQCGIEEGVAAGLLRHGDAVIAIQGWKGGLGNTNTMPDEFIVECFHPYEAEKDDELTLHVGDRLRVSDKSDPGWWIGERLTDGKSGWFPSNFVSAVQESQSEAPTQPREDHTVPTSATAVDAVTATDAAHDAPPHDAPPHVAPPHDASAPAEDASAPPKDTAVSPASLTPDTCLYGSGPILARVEYDYEPKEPGELSLEVGRVITVLNKSDSAWWTGDCNGKVGTFPSNYVKLIEKDEPTEKAQKFKLAAFGVKQGGLGSLFAGGVVPGLKKTGGLRKTGIDVATGKKSSMDEPRSPIATAPSVPKATPLAQPAAPAHALPQAHAPPPTHALPTAPAPASVPVQEPTATSAAVPAPAVASSPAEEEASPSSTEPRVPSRAKKPKAKQTKAIVMYDYTAQEEDEISLVKGDTIVITDRLGDEGWWAGRDEQGNTGNFPSDFVELIKDEASEPSTAQPATTAPLPTPADPTHTQVTMSEAPSPKVVVPPPLPLHAPVPLPIPTQPVAVASPTETHRPELPRTRTSDSSRAIPPPIPKSSRPPSIMASPPPSSPHLTEQRPLHEVPPPLPSSPPPKRTSVSSRSNSIDQAGSARVGSRPPSVVLPAVPSPEPVSDSLSRSSTAKRPQVSIPEAPVEEEQQENEAHHTEHAAPSSSRSSYILPSPVARSRPLPPLARPPSIHQENRRSVVLPAIPTESEELHHDLQKLEEEKDEEKEETETAAAPCEELSAQVEPELKDRGHHEEEPLKESGHPAKAAEVEEVEKEQVEKEEEDEKAKKHHESVTDAQVVVGEAIESTSDEQTEKAHAEESVVSHADTEADAHVEAEPAPAAEPEKLSLPDISASGPSLNHASRPRPAKGRKLPSVPIPSQEESFSAKLEAEVKAAPIPEEPRKDEQPPASVSATPERAGPPPKPIKPIFGKFPTPFAGAQPAAVALRPTGRRAESHEAQSGGSPPSSSTSSTAAAAAPGASAPAVAPPAGGVKSLSSRFNQFQGVPSGGNTGHLELELAKLKRFMNEELDKVRRELSDEREKREQLEAEVKELKQQLSSSLRRRWMDATQSGVVGMTSGSHQHFSRPGTPLSNTTPQPNNLQQQDDPGPGAKLPVECIELIVSHMEDLWTLWSLLTVNKRFAAVVLRRLYMNPYRSILLGFLFHEGLPIRRLAQRILTLTHVSPSDPYIQSIKRVLKINDASSSRLQPDQPTWIDYLALIREVEWPTDIWEELYEFFHEVGTEMAKDPQLRREDAQAIEADDPRWSCPPALVQSTLTWAACGGSAEQLGRIKKLWIPIQDIERYLDPNVIAQLTQLEEVVFDVRYASIKTDFEATFLNGISFVRSHRCHHLSHGSNNRVQGGQRSTSSSGSGSVSGARLDSARFERLSWRGYEHLERELYSLLPPLYKPKHLTKENWDRFMVKPQETDTCRLESIFYEEPDKVDWGPFLPEIPSFLLPTCRRLVRLRLRVRAKEVATIFHWAVEEKRNSIRRRSMTGDSQGHEDDALVQLEEVDLTCDRGTMRRVIQDITFAFGHSLRVINIMPAMEDLDDDTYSETANFGGLHGGQAGTNHNDGSHEPGEALGEGGEQSNSTAKLCIGAGWDLPRLVRLSIVSIGPRIELDPKALTHSRRLEMVRLRDDATIHSISRHDAQSFDQLSYDEWILPSATRIKLIGHTATKFNPASLAWMRRLTWLELSQNAALGLFSFSTGDTPPLSSSPTYATLPSGSPPSSTSTLTPPLSYPARSLWTWDWDLPALQSLILVGTSALLFELKFLQHTPNLRALSLDIHRINKEFTWTAQSDVSCPHLEELCLTGRWSISNETLQFILLGSAGSPSSSDNATTSTTTSTRAGSPSDQQELSAKSTSANTTNPSNTVTTPCPALSYVLLLHCCDFSLQQLVQACEQRRPRTLKNIRCSYAVSVPEARKMGLELLEQNCLTYSNPYVTEAISYHAWATYHSRNQGLLSMLSSPTSQQQPTNCVYTLNDTHFRTRRWPWTK
ncbi:Pyruvate kinase [Actinomortierella ambigua]|nr:Pyruvate kinase [Actinomortierella ambigua]